MAVAETGLVEADKILERIERQRIRRGRMALAESPGRYSRRNRGIESPARQTGDSRRKVIDLTEHHTDFKRVARSIQRRELRIRIEEREFGIDGIENDPDRVAEVSRGLISDMILCIPRYALRVEILLGISTRDGNKGYNEW